MARHSAPELATVEVLLIGLASPRRSSPLMGELSSLHARGVLKVIDAVVIKREPDHSITAVSHTQLTQPEADQVRSFMTKVLDFHPQEPESSASLHSKGASVLFGPDDVRSIAEMLGPHESALAVIVEHRWAARLGKLLRGGGVTLHEDYLLSPEMLGGRGGGISMW